MTVKGLFFFLSKEENSEEETKELRPNSRKGLRSESFANLHTLIAAIEIFQIQKRRGVPLSLSLSLFPSRAEEESGQFQRHPEVNPLTNVTLD